MVHSFNSMISVSINEFWIGAESIPGNVIQWNSGVALTEYLSGSGLEFFGVSADTVIDRCVVISNAANWNSMACTYSYGYVCEL